MFTATPRGLETLASELEFQLALSVSSGPQGKSASMHLDIDGKAKKWILNPLPYLRIPKDTIPSVSVTQVYRYLGVDVSPCSTKVNVAGILREGLRSISSAPLKPLQRLYIATYNPLPKFQHQLALTPASAKYLGWLDRTVRPVLRSWLKLLKDTPVPFFHAPVVEGGLGVPFHKHVVPLMWAKHLSRLEESADPVRAAMLKTVSASAGSALRIRQTNLNGRVMTSSRNLKATLAGMLHQTVDGRGLVHSSQVPEYHRWVNLVSCGPVSHTGSSNIPAIKVRGNLIGTTLRSPRGRPQAFPFTEIHYNIIHGLPSTLQVNCLLCGKKTWCHHPKHTDVAAENQNLMPLMLTAEHPSLHLMPELSTPFLAP